jgi:ornithine carbamoyltransferase
MGEEAEQARPHALFMHCLPAHCGQEVVAEVIDGPVSVVWQQATNRMPTEQAVVYLFVTGEWETTNAEVWD